MASSPSQSTHRLLSAAASVNATLVQAGPTVLTGITCVNGAAITYLKLYDKATAPAGSDTPRRTILIPANATYTFESSLGMVFGLGLGYRLTAAAADADTTAVASAAILCLNIDYS
jgi:hypothetical protein